MSESTTASTVSTVSVESDSPIVSYFRDVPKMFKEGQLEPSRRKMVIGITIVIIVIIIIIITASSLSKFSIKNKFSANTTVFSENVKSEGNYTYVNVGSRGINTPSTREFYNNTGDDLEVSFDFFQAENEIIYGDDPAQWTQQVSLEMSQKPFNGIVLPDSTVNKIIVLQKELRFLRGYFYRFKAVIPNNYYYRIMVIQLTDLGPSTDSFDISNLVFSPNSSTTYKSKTDGNITTIYV